MLNLEDFVRTMFDDVGDGMAVGRTEEERLQDEEIEGSLQQVGFERRGCAFRHFEVVSGRSSTQTPQDDLWERNTPAAGNWQAGCDEVCGIPGWRAGVERVIRGNSVLRGTLCCLTMACKSYPAQMMYGIPGNRKASAMTHRIQFAILALLCVATTLSAVSQSEKKTTPGGGPGGLAQAT